VSSLHGPENGHSSRALAGRQELCTSGEARTAETGATSRSAASSNTFYLLASCIYSYILQRYCATLNEAELSPKFYPLSAESRNRRQKAATG
jgi:hypothetical protein